jgi:hypothetical protein
MADKRMPYQIIDEMTAIRRRSSDKKILAELAMIPPLADQDDPCWDREEYWHQVAYPYLALWTIAAERRLRAAIPLMLERACFGDPGEIMRNLCHALEAIVEPKWSLLTAPCVAALKSPRPGTRLWAADELQRVRDPAAIPALEEAVRDEVEEVREQAQAALRSTREALQNGRAE